MKTFHYNNNSLKHIVPAIAISINAYKEIIYFYFWKWSYVIVTEKQKPLSKFEQFRREWKELMNKSKDDYDRKYGHIPSIDFTKFPPDVAFELQKIIGNYTDSLRYNEATVGESPAN